MRASPVSASRHLAGGCCRVQIPVARSCISLDRDLFIVASTNVYLFPTALFPVLVLLEQTTADDKPCGPTQPYACRCSPGSELQRWVVEIIGSSLSTSSSPCTFGPRSRGAPRWKCCRWIQNGSPAQWAGLPELCGNQPMAYLPLTSFVFENASPKIPARLGVHQSAGYLLT